MDFFRAFWRAIPFIIPLAVLGEILLYFQGYASSLGLAFVLVSGAFTLSVYSGK